jgi:uncharacterized protein YlxW (UPF0749 family)
MSALWISGLWKPIAIAALIAALLAYRAVLVHQRDAARARAQAAQAQVLELQASNAALTSSIAQQNAALDALRARAQAAAAAAGSREAAYAKSGAEAMAAQAARARALREAAVPADCIGAIRWGNAQGPGLGQW